VYSIVKDKGTYKILLFGKSASSSFLRVHSYSILENKSSHTLIFFFLFQKSHVITLTNVFISWFVKLNLCVYFTVYKASLFVLNLYTTIIYLFIYNCLETLSTNKNKNLQYFYTFVFNNTVHQYLLCFLIFSFLDHLNDPIQILM
jgi:hypothetical protein